MPQQCTHEETKTVSEVDDTGDIRKTVCVEEGCGYVVKEEVLVKRPDGSDFWRPRGVKAENQPEHFEFTGKGGEALSPEERILSAHEMALLAVKTREETVGKQARELVRDILDCCVEHVLDGEYTHQVKPDDEVPGEILTLAIKELKAQGYRVKKTPQPGEGVWIEVKWSTQIPRKKKKGQPEDLEIKIGKPPEKTSSAKQQAAAAKHRKAALWARSKSPT